MVKVRAIILDFDGVLVESNAEKTEAFKELFSLYPDYEKKMLDYHFQWFSTSRMKKFRYFVFELMNRPGDMDCVMTMAAQFSNLVLKRVVSCPDVLGAREFLEEFSRHLPIYISSTTPQDELREIVRCRGLEKYLTGIYGDPPVKKKEAIRSVLEKEKALPEEVLFIGDAVSDYVAARETAVRFIGRDSGLSFQNLDVRLCKDLFEIADLIRQWKEASSNEPCG